MKQNRFPLVAAFLGVIYANLADAYTFLQGRAAWAWIGVIAAAVLINILAGVSDRAVPTRRLRVCDHGVRCLQAFCVALPLSVICHILLAVRLLPGDWRTLLWSALFCAALLCVLFWNGMICVYCTSLQLGLRVRLPGLVCGLIPVANLVMLGKILGTCGREVASETEKHLQNESRKDARICATKYPILLVHGVFFRDFRQLNYWGRIPGELTKNGATVFYGEHSSAASVADSGAELSARIAAICKETGCEKVNIIAHSKGGLDSRSVLAGPMGARVASLTTINTPHRGCGFADYLLSKVPAGMQKSVAQAYEAGARKLGDPSPDFLAAVQDLTAARCTAFDAAHPAPEGVFCQSVGSVQRGAGGGRFPLNFSYRLAKYFDGENDGLVALPSMWWGDNRIHLRAPGSRGISHGDMIDLNREDIPGFDVREFYVQLVADLKNRGL